MMFKLPAIFLALAFLAPAFSLLHAQNAPAAPVPSQILTAKKVFISNGNLDDPSKGWFSGGPQRTYDEFYNDIKNETQFQIVSTPNEADLVLEINFKSDAAAVYFQLSVLDPKTQTLLWKLASPFSPNGTKATRDKNFSAGMVKLVSDFKSLANQPASPAK